MQRHPFHRPNRRRPDPNPTGAIVGAAIAGIWFTAMVWGALIVYGRVVGHYPYHRTVVDCTHAQTETQRTQCLNLGSPGAIYLWYPSVQPARCVNKPDRPCA